MQFSIITCTYNVEKKLAKTLDSVLLQNFSDYEIIVIDGRSTDKTLEVAKEYEIKFKGKLRWISEKDLGIYDAMNKGVKMAKGDWLYFLNSGDIFYNYEILKKVNFEIEKDNLNSIFYGKIELENTGLTYGEEWTAEKLLKGNISHQAIFFSKNIFDIFGFYDIKYKTLADWVFNMKWFNSAEVRFKYINLIIAKYELNGRSRINYDENFYLDYENNIQKFFSQQNLIKFGKINRLAFHLFKNEKFWRFWKWKNEINLKIKIFLKKVGF